MGQHVGYLARPREGAHTLVVEPAATLASAPEARHTARRRRGQRVQWQGTLSGIAYRTLSGRARAHACVTDVADDDGVTIFARIWLPLGVTLRSLSPETGGPIAFSAGVEEQLDGTYRLVRPGQFRRVTAVR